MLINAVTAAEQIIVVKVVSEVLYIAMIDNLRQQFYPRMRQACRDRTIFDSHRKGFLDPCVKKFCFSSSAE